MKRGVLAVLAAILLLSPLWATDSPEQLYEKAMAALTGAGPGRSEVEARKYMQQAAEAGYVPAQTALGYFYEAGVTTAAEPGEALKWYRKAAESGDPLGEYLLGRMYLTGQATAVDKREAEKWLLRAADQGNPFAAYLLGTVEEDLDYRRAPEWYLKAAEQGLPQSQARYGQLLLSGRGTTINKFDAYVWILLANEAGNSSANLELTQLEGELGTAATERAKIRAHGMQTEVTRPVRARGCTGWPGEFDAMPAPPPAEVQRFCR